MRRLDIPFYALFRCFSPKSLLPVKRDCSARSRDTAGITIEFSKFRRIREVRHRGTFRENFVPREADKSAKLFALCRAERKKMVQKDTKNEGSTLRLHDGLLPSLLIPALLKTGKTSENYPNYCPTAREREHIQRASAIVEKSMNTPDEMILFSTSIFYLMLPLIFRSAYQPLWIPFNVLIWLRASWNLRAAFCAFPAI